MSVIDTRADGRRAAERDAAERRKKLILLGLAVVLVVLLAFELPKLMKGSSSSSSTASTPVATPATPVAAGNASLAMASTAAKRARTIRRMAAKDPFVPLIRESASTTTTTSAPASAPAPAPTSTPTTQPAIGFTASATSVPLPLPQATPNPAVIKPAHVKPAAPTAAVIRTNGQRQVVGLSQAFSIGDAHFRLVSVTRKAMRIKVVGGLFAGGKQTITVRKGHPLKLANTATGVEYRLLFRAGTTEAPTVIPPVNATPAAAASASAAKSS
jgi:hypothetical protein